MKSPVILRDDISLYYSQKAYPIIFMTENLMRQLLTKFMLINAGFNWKKERTLDDVLKSVKEKNKENTSAKAVEPNKEPVNETTSLYHVDFIQLSKFLFSGDFPNHKSTLLAKLKATIDSDQFSKKEIRSLLPVSNWEKYFSVFLQVEADSLEKKWKQLSDLRNQVAHNRTFHRADFQTVEKLAKELKSILQKAIASLTTIEVSAADTEILEDTMGWMLKKVTNFKNMSDDEQEGLRHELGDIIFAFERDLDARKMQIDYLKGKKRSLEDQLPKADKPVENTEIDPVVVSKQQALEVELKDIQSQIEDEMKGIKMTQTQINNYDSLYRRLSGEWNAGFII